MELRLIPVLKHLIGAAAISVAAYGMSGHALAADSRSSADGVRTLVSEGESLRSAGKLVPAQDRFNAALALARTRDEEVHIAALAASGYNEHLLQLHERARQHLLGAYQKSAARFPYLHAVAGNYLGMAAISEGDPDLARQYFTDALMSAEAGKSELLTVGISLELAKLETDVPQRLQKLIAIERRCSRLPDSEIRARHYLSLGEQMLRIDKTQLSAQEAKQALEVSYRALTAPQRHAMNSDHTRLKAEIQGAMSRLYRSEGRNAEALRLTNRTINFAQQANAKELLAIYEAQRGDLLRLDRDFPAALAAYRRAVSHLSSIRSAIPINLLDGRSSVDALVDPIYRGYADLLLRSVNDVSSVEGQQAISLAIDSMEAIKNADLQDFLLERCTIGKDENSDWHHQSFPGAVVVYPVLLPDRVEILVKTGDRLNRQIVHAPASKVSLQVDDLAFALRNGKDYRAPSQQLYEWFFRPIEADLQHINPETLLYVPDRSIRSIPLTALSDGKQFVVAKYAVVTLPSLDLGIFREQPAERGQGEILIAGISKPDGPSIDQLPVDLVATLRRNMSRAQDVSSRRSNVGAVPDTGEMQPADARTSGMNVSGRDILVKNLSLPGVEKEISTIGKTRPSKILLNQSFTTGALKSGIQSGGYPNVHIASHGYFGKNVKDSFIMAYDKNLNLIDFEGMLKSDQVKQSPINLLTLSACETAAGDDRVLLGFSGLAIKSNALSAVGTLWASDDQATVEFMTRFYDGLGKSMPKAQAMRQAQLAMLGSKQFQHPYFWSPFVLVGNWK